MIQYDLPDLLSLFDEILPESNEELKFYCLKYTREDGITIQLDFNGYDGGAGLFVQSAEGVTYSSLHFEQCTYIRALDLKKKQFEMVALVTPTSAVRCFVALNGHGIMSTDYPYAVDR